MYNTENIGQIKVVKASHFIFLAIEDPTMTNNSFDSQQLIKFFKLFELLVVFASCGSPVNIYIQTKNLKKYIPQ